MTSGIQGTGLYSKLRRLRVDKSALMYKLKWRMELGHGKNKCRDFEKELVYLKGRIKELNAEIKANKTKK